MQSIKFKKTFVFRVALASVLSFLVSLSSLVYQNKRVEALEGRLQAIEAAQITETTQMSDFSFKLSMFEPTSSPTPSAEDALRAVQSDTPQMSECRNQTCWDF